MNEPLALRRLDPDILSVEEEAEGIYFLLDQDGAVVYIGCSQNVPKKIERHVHFASAYWTDAWGACRPMVNALVRYYKPAGNDWGPFRSQDWDRLLRNVAVWDVSDDHMLAAAQGREALDAYWDEAWRALGVTNRPA